MKCIKELVYRQGATGAPAKTLLGVRKLTKLPYYHYEISAITDIATNDILALLLDICQEVENIVTLVCSKIIKNNPNSLVFDL